MKKVMVPDILVLKKLKVDWGIIMGKKLREKDYRKGYEDGFRDALKFALESVKYELNRLDYEEESKPQENVIGVIGDTCKECGKFAPTIPDRICDDCFNTLLEKL